MISLNVHVSQEKELEAQGWVRLLIQREGNRIEMVNPEETCLAPTQGQQCLLDTDHRGYHSVAVFYCDSCGHMRRTPWAAADEEIRVCFFCLKTGEREMNVQLRLKLER